MTAAATTAAASGEGSRRRRPEPRQDQVAATPGSRSQGLTQHRDRGQGQDPGHGQDRVPVPGRDLRLQSGPDRDQFPGLVRVPGPDHRPPDARNQAANRDRFRDRALVQDQGRQPRAVPGLAQPDPGPVLLPEKEAIRINLIFVSFLQFLK